MELRKMYAEQVVAYFSGLYLFPGVSKQNHDKLVKIRTGYLSIVNQMCRHYSTARDMLAEGKTNCCDIRQSVCSVFR
jgi:hypothetical protein